MGELEKGLEFCREKLIVQKNRLGEIHPRIARTLMIMASVCEEDDPKEALQYYEKALSILEQCIPPNHQTTSDCLASIACLYNNCDKFQDALRYYLKALDLCRQLLSSDHIDIANNLRNIGVCYENTKNPSEALRYYNESLSIYKLNYGPEHERVKELENDIAGLNDEQPSTSANEIGKENIEEKPCFDSDLLCFGPTPRSNHVHNKKSSILIETQTYF